MDRQEQEDEQGLRKVAGERRSLHLRSDESPDDEETSTLMRLFGRFLETEFSEVRRFLGALTCFVPWSTYTCLTQEYRSFVTWPAEAAQRRRIATYPPSRACYELGRKSHRNADFT